MDKESLYQFLKESWEDYNKIPGVITLEGDKLFYELKVNQVVYDIETCLFTAQDKTDTLLTPVLEQYGYKLGLAEYNFSDQYVSKEIIRIY